MLTRTRPIPDAVLAQHTAFLGKTGSGKTSTAKLAVEQIVRDNPSARVCVLDPIKSDWWGLTSSADGKKPGLPFHVLGGPRGHVPLHDSAGKAIGELVATGALPLSIIDMADFPAGGLQKFFNDFAPALMKKMRGVVYLVIEEAHEFAPKERSGIGAENMAIHWAKKLATAGRSKGIRMMVLTQRTQALHNALLGSCDTMIAHRLTAPADQEPVKKWLKANVSKEIFEKVSSSLSSLKTGSGWLCSGEAQVADLVQFPKISTYDNSATPTGDSTEHHVKTAPVDQEKLRSIIGDAVKEAEADNPKTLKAEIVRLTRELATKPPGVPTPDPKAVDDAYQNGLAEGLARGESRAKAALAAVQRSLNEALATAGASIEGLDSPMPAAMPRRQVAAPPVRAARLAAPQRQNAGLSGERLPPGETAVLIAAAQFGTVEREQLTILTGYKRSSRDAYIQRLREKRFIEVSGSTVTPTQAGLDALPADYEPLPTGDGLQAYWLARLPEGERRVLEVLVGAYPASVERADIDTATGYQRSSRDAYLQRMKAKRLWEKDGSAVRASEVLFA